MRTAKTKMLGFALLCMSMLFSACLRNSTTQAEVRGTNLTKEEKHRLYAAALAASDSPLDTQSFKGACQTIGIFDQQGHPNEKYMTFVTEHFEWSSTEPGQLFRRQIDTREKAGAYVKDHLQ
jgi:hypothetical protein